MNEGRWILYGANGYTGELCAQEAKRRGMKPILAGRREEAVRPVAERLGFEARIFPLDSPGQVANELEGVQAILLCAGPFSATSGPVLEACLKSRTSYLDITGEIAVLEACHGRGAEARERGIVVIPGVGFDVVPSDCLALSLKEALPGANRLELAFAARGRFSPGTAKTMVEGLPRGGAIREAGRIRRVPLGWRTKEIPFPEARLLAVTIPWGDVSTAYYSTGIPNIRVYAAVSPNAVRKLRRFRLLAPFFGLGPIQRFLKKRAERAARVPTEEERRTRRVQLWGRVESEAGRSVEGFLETPEGYRLTAEASVECVRRILQGGIEPGAKTPAMAFGAKFITGFAGCTMRIEGEPSAIGGP